MRKMESKKSRRSSQLIFHEFPWWVSLSFIVFRDRRDLHFS
jgi:hypothetical protein